MLAITPGLLSNPSIPSCARLQADQSGAKDLIPVRPVAVLVSNFEGQADEMYQLV